MKWGAKDSRFKDGFENALAGTWVTGGTPDTWGRSLTYWRTGSWSLSDSPSGQYANNTDNYAALTQGLDLTGKRDCAASVYARTALSDDDLLLAETSPDWVSWGKRVAARAGTSSGFERWLIDLSELEGRADGGLLFRLFTNASGTDEGVALDDLEIFCVPPITGFTGAPDEFAIDWGTSMAAPHVTGTAALLLSLAPQLTPAQLKQVILATADPLPGLTGKTVTGGRLNAGSAVGLVADALAQVAAAPSQASPPPSPPTTSSGQAARRPERDARGGPQVLHAQPAASRSPAPAPRDDPPAPRLPCGRLPPARDRPRAAHDRVGRLAHGEADTGRRVAAAACAQDAPDARAHVRACVRGARRGGEDGGRAPVAWEW